ncbi:MAG: hypothetical protein JO060_02705, partial [Candidatus Eremiobacteraeota bacterium]|nr:hypothetical protein [Candidatus Eremiobacteraeota bacterium]
ASLGLTGEETYDIAGLSEQLTPGATLGVVAHKLDGQDIRFQAVIRIDTPDEADYYRHGGILQYVLRQLRQAA